MVPRKAVCKGSRLLQPPVKHLPFQHRTSVGMALFFLAGLAVMTRGMGSRWTGSFEPSQYPRLPVP